MSKIIGRPLYAPAPAGGGKPSAPKFTYDGDYVIRDDGVVELLTNGTLVFLEPKVIDVFMVGGGGGGGMSVTSNRGFGGGGGGYTRTIKRLNVEANTQIPITVGAGGAVSSNANGNPGEDSSFNLYSVPGGKGGNNSTSAPQGGNGGSGGGTGITSNSDYGAGGSDGANGEGNGAGVPGGTGQGFTTREFGEASGKLYAGGGGGGRYMSSQTPIISSGGIGGGGSGGWAGSNSSLYQPAAAGVANTGGGGGGGAITTSAAAGASAGTGGSGIVCFRDAQELPELAGTWVLNERLYTSESNVSVYTSFTGKKENTQSPKNFTSMNVDVNAVTAKLAGSSTIGLYTFSNNKWEQKYKIITFPAGATASDEFRAWLASNATKQTA